MIKENTKANKQNGKKNEAWRTGCLDVTLDNNLLNYYYFFLQVQKGEITIHCEVFS